MVEMQVAYHTLCVTNKQHENAKKTAMTQIVDRKCREISFRKCLDGTPRRGEKLTHPPFMKTFPHSFQEIVVVGHKHHISLCD